MKYLLIIVIGILLLLMFILLERANGFGFYLNDRQAFLFVGLAILTGSCLIALCALPIHNTDIHRAYCKISEQLEDGPLTRDELGLKIGSKEHGYGTEDDLRNYFSRNQLVLLERLIYEGKINERKGKLSLPS